MKRSGLHYLPPIHGTKNLTDRSPVLHRCFIWIAFGTHCPPYSSIKMKFTIIWVIWTAIKWYCSRMLAMLYRLIWAQIAISQFSISSTSRAAVRIATLWKIPVKVSFESHALRSTPSYLISSVNDFIRVYLNEIQSYVILDMKAKYSHLLN